MEFLSMDGLEVPSGRPVTRSMSGALTKKSTNASTNVPSRNVPPRNKMLKSRKVHTLNIGGLVADLTDKLKDTETTLQREQGHVQELQEKILVYEDHVQRLTKHLTEVTLRDEHKTALVSALQTELFKTQDELTRFQEELFNTREELLKNQEELVKTQEDLKRRLAKEL